jgi:hypothetical protein
MEDNTLNKYWDSVKSENYNNSIREVENFIRKEAYFGVEKSTVHKSVFIKTLSENKIKYAVILASLLIIYISGKVPVTQSKAIGNVVSWNINKNSDDAISKLDNFRWLDKSNLIVSDTIIDNNEVLNYKMLLPPEIDKSQLALIRDNLIEMGDISGYNIVPIYEPVKRPVYAAALYSLFNMDMTSIPVNKADIINNVSKQLQIAGLEDDVDIDFDDEDNIPARAYVVPKKDIYSYGIKLHDDIVRSVNIAKSIGNIKRTLANRNMMSDEDSIIKKIVVKLDDHLLKSLSYNPEM